MVTPQSDGEIMAEVFLIAKTRYQPTLDVDDIKYLKNMINFLRDLIFLLF